jgi:hypothetical protein
MGVAGLPTGRACPQILGWNQVVVVGVRNGGLGTCEVGKTV